MTQIPAPPAVPTNKSTKAKKVPTAPVTSVATPVPTPAATADMVSMSRADFEALIAQTVQKTIASVDPKAVKEAKKAQAKLDRKAANKARGDEAVQRCMAGGRNSEETVKAVFREAYATAKGLSGDAYKDTYNAVCIAKLGVPRYVATKAA
jgi:hypothetical protein